MSNPNYIGYTPRWARDELDAPPALNESPIVGDEPLYAPRLPTRLLPERLDNTVSSRTISDTVEITQKIITFAAQEAAFGVQFEFASLRAVNPEVAELSKLHFEPFEPGSFVIPANLDERSIALETTEGQRILSSRDILHRFVSAMDGIPSDPQFPASIGLVSAVEELGRIIRREATLIEYLPTGFSTAAEKFRRVSVDAEYTRRVSQNLKRRFDTQFEPDSIEGQLTAVDVTKAKIKLRFANGNEIIGTFERTAAETVIAALNRNVLLHGVVGRSNGRPTGIRVFYCEIQ